MTQPRDVRPNASGIKFVVDAALAAGLAAWARTHLLADPHGDGVFGDEYDTATRYFDTPAHDVFHRRGSFGRAKYRVRRYGGSWRAPRRQPERRSRIRPGCRRRSRAGAALDGASARRPSRRSWLASMLTGTTGSTAPSGRPPASGWPPAARAGGRGPDAAAA